MAYKDEKFDEEWVAEALKNEKWCQVQNDPFGFPSVRRSRNVWLPDWSYLERNSGPFLYRGEVILVETCTSCIKHIIEDVSMLRMVFIRECEKSEFKKLPNPIQDSIVAKSKLPVPGTTDHIAGQIWS